MRHILPALVAAGVLFAPLALAQEGAAPAGTVATPPASVPADAGQAGVPAEVPAAADALIEAEGVAQAPGAEDDLEDEHSGTPHYPIEKPAELNWSFAGPFGTWDMGQLQRGLKVYSEVCAACHSMNLVSFRNLEGLGYSEEQARAFAAGYQVVDGLDLNGDPLRRPALPSDRFPAPFPTPEAAAAANNGAIPPDFSLLAKARAVERGFPTFVFDIVTQYAQGGPDYIHALLTGYEEEPPAGLEIQPGTYYNPHFIAGPALAMAQPVYDDQVQYTDGAPQTVDQYARDVSAFLMWAAEPHLVERKATGLVVMIFFIIFASLLFLVKRRVWNDTPH